MTKLIDNFDASWDVSESDVPFQHVTLIVGFLMLLLFVVVVVVYLQPGDCIHISDR